MHTPFFDPRLSITYLYVLVPLYVTFVSFLSNIGSGTRSLLEAMSGVVNERKAAVGRMGRKCPKMNRCLYSTKQNESGGISCLDIIDYQALSSMTPIRIEGV